MKNPLARKRILAVCTGNTCRSPMVEAIIRKELGFFGRLRFKVESAGVSGGYGQKICDNSATALREIGINASGHKSRKLTPKMAKKANISFALSDTHAEHLRSLGAKNVHCLQVKDPYLSSLEVYRQTRDEIKTKLYPYISVFKL